jgi:predicted nucleic acid-binding protein
VAPIPPKIFLDSSVVFAGCHSPSGGSAVILDACRSGLLRCVISRIIFLETRQALFLKSGSAALRRFGEFLDKGMLHFADIPEPEALEAYTSLLPVKDCHVLAAAIAARCERLMTLDRRHFFSERILSADLPLKICTPAQFLKEWADR